MTENWRGQDALPRYDWMRWIYVEKDLFLAIEVARSAIQRSAMALVEFQRLHDRLRIVRTHDDERGDILSTVKTEHGPRLGIGPHTPSTGFLRALATRSRTRRRGTGR